MQKRVKLPYLKHQFLEYHGCVEVIWVLKWNLEPNKGTTLVENFLRKMGFFLGGVSDITTDYFKKLDLLVLN